MDLFGNPDICLGFLEMCDVNTARELCFALLSSRKYRNYGTQYRIWERLIQSHFGPRRHYDSLYSFESMPQVFQNPHWPESFIPEVDELSPPCKEFLETAMERSLFESIKVIPGDIGRIREIDDVPVDCIIFPTNSSLVSFGVGAAGAISNRAGPELMSLVRSEAYQRIRRRTTDAIVTPGFNTGVDYLIHCVGPSPHRPDCQENLYRTYLNALKRAREVGARCVVIASISTGALGFPAKKAAELAMRAFRDFIKSLRWSAKVSIVCMDKKVENAMIAEHANILRRFNDGCLDLTQWNAQETPFTMEIPLAIPPQPLDD
ncbi:Ganglioside-induced differentiation-associated protein 2 [Aphanomyces cochlioides]|nr:Ganglioside-induced differentiation-associated protein 2 [Aphanomyces cochlioides]